MTELFVFDIQRYSLHDGPGIRTTVFLKGCPLNCIWCHNPESKSSNKQNAFLEQNCVLCGRCIASCSRGLHRYEDKRHYVDFSDCTFCGICIEKCISDALKCYGTVMQPDSILKIAMQDREFYRNSGGGITISGGEPMAQFEGLLELLKISKSKNLHTCLDTSGIAQTEHYEQVLPYVDCFLFDHKLTDEKKHIKYTGVSNKLALKNLAYLSKNGANIHLRCPIIPGINNDDEHLRGIVKLAFENSGIQKVEIMAYHNIGSSKARQLGIVWEMGDLPTMTKEEKLSVHSRLKAFECPNLIG